MEEEVFEGRVRAIDRDPEQHLRLLADDVQKLGRRVEKRTIPDKEIAIHVSIFKERLNAIRRFLEARNASGRKAGLVKDRDKYDWKKGIAGIPDWHLFRVSSGLRESANALEKKAMDAEVDLALSEDELLLAEIQQFVDERSSPGFSSAELAKMQKNSGYREIMANAELRQKIAKGILRAAEPAMIGYYGLRDELEKMMEGRVPRVAVRHAWNFLFLQPSKAEKFVFTELIEHDAAYRAFLSQEGFRDAFLASMHKHNVTEEDRGKAYNDKVQRVAEDLKKKYDIDAFFFAKFFVGTRQHRKSLDALN